VCQIIDHFAVKVLCTSYIKYRDACIYFINKMCYRFNPFNVNSSSSVHFYRTRNFLFEKFARIKSSVVKIINYLFARLCTLISITSRTNYFSPLFSEHEPIIRRGKTGRNFFFIIVTVRNGRRIRISRLRSAGRVSG